MEMWLVAKDKVFEPLEEFKVSCAVCKRRRGGEDGDDCLPEQQEQGL